MINQQRCFPRSNYRHGRHGDGPSPMAGQGGGSWDGPGGYALLMLTSYFRSKQDRILKGRHVFVVVVVFNCQPDLPSDFFSGHWLEWTIGFRRFQEKWGEAVCIPKGRTCERVASFSFLSGQTLGVFAYSAWPRSCWRLLIRPKVLLLLLYYAELL